ncbi:hypothetical protein BDN71DRAFT_1436049 [Pleurotus eryngii]|uniref:Uncharacterized protein n=1 Tax=Pleurotus eryngii TaxID=5323 RepID=A0A9P6DAD7_PLEER|nr:hypothetical protein BDN71DRAFT_1436049 [Pleurotus eryngii]
MANLVRSPIESLSMQCYEGHLRRDGGVSELARRAWPAVLRPPQDNMSGGFHTQTKIDITFLEDRKLLTDNDTGRFEARGHLEDEGEGFAGNMLCSGQVQLRTKNRVCTRADKRMCGRAGVQTNIRACRRASVQTSGRAGMQTDIRACGHASVQTSGRAGMQTDIRACGRASVQTSGRAGMQTDIRVCGRADVSTSGCTGVWACERADIRTCGRADGQMGTWTCRCEDIRTSGRPDAWMCGCRTCIIAQMGRFLDGIQAEEM